VTTYSLSCLTSPSFTQQNRKEMLGVNESSVGLADAEPAQHQVFIPEKLTSTISTH
jgi:hypothetical protein